LSTRLGGSRFVRASGNFELDVDAVRNWEYGRREPDRAAKSYLTVIDRDPERRQAALAAPVS